MTPGDERHGTSAGYQVHRRAREVACEPCREAWSAYIRGRRTDPALRSRDYQASKAGSRAAWRVVAAHRGEYERYYAEELTALRRADV